MWIKIVGAIVVLGGIVYAVMALSPSTRISIQKALHIEDQQKLATEQPQLEMRQTVAQVSKLMILPSSETPVMAKVTDAAMLAKQQGFFAKAQNGDELLIYTKARQAILYRPSQNVIVNVGPIQFGTPTQTSGGTPR